jgi:hypothetical protein
MRQARGDTATWRSKDKKAERQPTYSYTYAPNSQAADGSGRTLTQTRPDGSVTTISYAGSSVTTNWVRQ